MCDESSGSELCWLVVFYQGSLSYVAGLEEREVERECVCCVIFSLYTGSSVYRLVREERERRGKTTDRAGLLTGLLRYRDSPTRVHDK